jgi:4,5-dihydroxyphthalate decarboxylase
MPNVHLTIATVDYDHVRDFREGRVTASGIDATWLNLGLHEMFARFLANREWDVSELSFAKFIAEATRPDSDIIGLPVYPRREFRFGIYYVNRAQGIRTPADLRGKRVGIPEWAQTATVYTRGFLAHEFGVPLADVEWVQAGINEKGRVEKVELNLPPGVRITPVADRSLSEMLDAGEIAGLIGASVPACFGKNPDVVRLFPDFVEQDKRFYARTGVFPIMHVLAIRKAILRDNPWVARNLFNAFDEARRRSLARLRHPGHFALPWLPEHAAAMQETFGGDYFPYGIDQNRAALELFLRYAYEQGIAQRLVTPEEIFPAGIMVSGHA